MSDRADHSTLVTDWLQRVAVVMAVAAIALTVIAIVRHRSARAGMSGQLEVLRAAVEDERSDNTILQSGVDAKRQRVELITDQLKQKVEVVEQQKVAMAEVMARWRLLTEQRRAFEAIRVEVDEKIEDLYQLEKRMFDVGAAPPPRPAPQN